MNPTANEVIVRMHAAAVADANGTTLPCAGLATACVQVFGTVTTATIYFEGTVDGYTWVGVLGWNRNTGVKALTCANTTGIYVFDVTGLTEFRARLDWSAGSVDVICKGTPLPTTTLVTAS